MPKVLSKTMQLVMKNLPFIGVFLLTVVLIILIAVGLEMLKRRLDSKKGICEIRGRQTMRMAFTALFAAIACILFLFDFPLPIAPPFYKMDLSEIPVLLAGFTMGPVAAVVTEFLKVVLKILVKGTSTAFVGDFANFLIGCFLVLPASAVYYFHKTKKSAVWSLVIGGILMTGFGSFFNAFYLLPTFAKLYGTPLDKLVAMGSKIYPSVHNVETFVLFCVVPINLLKSLVTSVLLLLFYKQVSRPLHNAIR